MEKYSFNQNWFFRREKENSRRVLCLPHDAMMEEQRAPDCPSGSGGAYFAGGKYIYEKNFSVPEKWKGKTVLLQFEGVYRNAEVYLNGVRIAGWKYGYAPFWVELSEYLIYTGENQLRVTVDNQDTPNSRWYSGAGIYRPVWLWLGEKAHIHPEGIRIDTISYAPAEITVDVEASGAGDICVEILDGDCVVAGGCGSKTTIAIPDAKLWSAEMPHLYQCRVRLRNDDAIVDKMVQDFGIRKIEWNTRGLFINGQETLLRGGCIHQDSGILGSACYPEVELRRVKKLKEWGFNAVRSAHNPANPALLDACDKLGMYVMDEMWDMWYKPKTLFDYGVNFMENYAADIEATVRRDYNHPSVIMYSIGNEVTEPAEEQGVEMCQNLVDIIHRKDATRPVTCGMNLTLVMMAAMGISLESVQEPGQAVSSTDFNQAMAEQGKNMVAVAKNPEVEALSAPCLDILDIAGYNYATSRYPLEGEAHPDRILVGSETFPQDIAENWRMVEKYPYIVGDFMWTAWDYLGEVGLGSWCYRKGENTFAKEYPWLLAEAGVIDILGDDTAEAGLAAAVFEKRRKPYIGVRPVNHPGITPAIAIWRGTNAIPSWSWRDCEGNHADVEVYADAEEIELFLNGAAAGRTLVKDFTAKFELPYAPGKLEAVAYEGGREVGRSILASADGMLRIDIRPEDKLLRGRLAFVRINICGENGIIEANADQRLTVQVEGGTLLGFGSARPSTEESYLTGTFTTHYGRSMAVIRPESETLTVYVESASGIFSGKTFAVQ